MDTAEIRRRVRCSACRGKIRGRVNLVELARKAAWKYPTCGNVLTGEEGRAVAICCDACTDARRPIVEAVEFAGDAVVYHPVEALEAMPLSGAAVGALDRPFGPPGPGGPA